MFVRILKMAKSLYFILWISFNLIILQISFSTAESSHDEETSQTAKPSTAAPKSSRQTEIDTSKPLIEQLKGKRIICTFNSIYYFDRDQFSPDKIDPWKCTHINYQFAFLDEKTHTIVPGHEKLDIQKEFYKKVTELKNTAKGLKVFITLGGWGDSTVKYSHFVKDAAKRQNFIKHLIPFLEKHNFDGLDVAWEYPNGCQGAIGKTPEDKKHFPVFLKELKSQLSAKNFELSASVASIKREIEAAYDIPEVVKIVDFLNVMSFDMHGAWEGKTGHHAQFFPLPGESNSMDVITAMKLWVDEGAEKEKLNIGIPAYGRSYTLANNNDNGYDAKTKSAGHPGNNTKIPGYLAYNEICKDMEDNGWIVKDDAHRGPYAYKGDQWVAYDTPKQIIRKTKHVIDEGYGGIMIKDISSDDYNGYCYSVKFPLLTMCTQEILRREKVKAEKEAKANGEEHANAGAKANAEAKAN